MMDGPEPAEGMLPAPAGLEPLAVAFLTAGMDFITGAGEYAAAEKGMFDAAEHLRAAHHAWADKANEVIRLDDGLASADDVPDGSVAVIDVRAGLGMSVDQFGRFVAEFARLAGECSVAIGKFNQARAVADGAEKPEQWHRWKTAYADLAKAGQPSDTSPGQLTVGGTSLNDVIRQANIAHADLTAALTRYKNTVATMDLVAAENYRLWDHPVVKSMGDVAASAADGGAGTGGVGG